MTWKDINVFQWQQLNDLFLKSKDVTDLDLAISAASICTGLTEHEIDSLPVSDLQPLLKAISFIHEELKPQPERFIKLKGKRYKCIYDVRKIPAARYIETKHFGKDVNANLHRIAACMVMPMKRTLFGWKVVKYDASRHEEYSQDILEAPITQVLGSVVFFLSSLQKLDKEFEGLFDSGDDGEQTNEISSRGGISKFMQYYGWIYQTELVAAFERITLEEAYELPTIQFLNDLSYLKSKGEYEAEELRKAYAKK